MATEDLPLSLKAGMGIYRSNRMCQSKRPQNARECSPLPSGLDRIRHVDEAMLDTEALGQQLAEPAHPGSLRRVVAGGDEVDAQLARVPHRVLGRLAGYEGVEPGPGRLGEKARAGAGDDPDPAHGLRAGVEMEGVAAVEGGAPPHQLGRRQPALRDPDDAD